MQITSWYFPSESRGADVPARADKIGTRAADAIEGNRWFLNTVELDKLHRLREEEEWKPTKATEHLAYAVALDMRNAWEDYLANSDFHSIVWSASKTKPPSPGVSAVLATPCATGYGFVRKQVLIVWMTMSACLAIGKPSDFISFLRRSPSPHTFLVCHKTGILPKVRQCHAGTVI